MELIIEKPESVLNTSEIKTGMLVYAKHVSWKCGISGFVTAITEKEMIVQYHPRIGNVTNHFFISAKEVAAGDWHIRYSTDLSEVYEYPKPTDENTNLKDKNVNDKDGNTDDTNKLPEMEGMADNDIRGTDL